MTNPVRRFIAPGIIAMVLSGSASAQIPSISAQAAAVASAGQATIRAQQELIKSIPSTGTVGDELSRRVALISWAGRW